MPFAPLYLLLFLLAIVFLVAFVQVGLVTITFGKLGLSPESAFLLLVASLFGSGINLPLFSVRAQPPPDNPELVLRGLLRVRQRPFTGRTVIAVNVGGCLVPVGFSIFLLVHNSLGLGDVVLAVALVAGVSYALSRPLPGVGIAMPMFVAPVTAAVVAVLLGGTQSPSLAYIAGSLGVLLGADVLRLGDVKKLGTPLASIGGAGTFDGIFISGLVAVLLA